MTKFILVVGDDPDLDAMMPEIDGMEVLPRCDEMVRTHLKYRMRFIKCTGRYNC